MQERRPGRGRRVYGAFLLMLDAELLARVTIRETLTFTLSQGLGAKLARVLLGIGQAVEHEVIAAAQASPTRPAHASPAQQLAAVVGPKARKTRAAQFNAEKELFLEGGWSAQLRAQVGGVLLQMLLESAYVTVDHGSGRLVEERTLGLDALLPAPALAVNPLQALHRIMSSAPCTRTGARSGALRLGAALSGVVAVESVVFRPSGGAPSSQN